jgi:very-short-patch-repair endonuclease
LRAKKFYGLQFNRQFALGNFIVDFICRQLKLIIEIDGSSHQHKTGEDQLRDAELSKLGYQVLRIFESNVLNDLNNVIRSIEAFLSEDFPDSQSPKPCFSKGELSQLVIDRYEFAILLVNPRYPLNFFV